MILMAGRLNGAEREENGGRLQGVRRLFFAARQPLLDATRMFGGRKREIEELRSLHAAVAEQNRHNELRAQAWRLALDRGATEGVFIQNMLDAAGPAMGLSRAVFLGIDPETGDARTERQWCAEGVGPDAGLRMPAGLCTLCSGMDCIGLPGDANQAAQGLGRILGESGTKACLLMPCRGAEELLGFIAFTDRAERAWSNAERGTLGEMAAIISTRAEHAMLERKARRAENMALIGRLAAGVSHDLNNMLSAVSGYAQLIRIRNTKAPELCKHADSIMSAARRAADIVEKLVAFSGQGRYNVTVCSANGIIDDAVALLLQTAETQGVSIVKKLDAERPLISAYGVQVSKALLGIGIRAMGDMRNGGTLTYESEVVELARSFSRSKPYKIPPGRYVRISVKDTGAGMGKEAVAALFEPYSTGRGGGAAAGLEMAGAYGTVKSHGGYIEAKSEVGRGTTVDVYFPVAASAPAAEHTSGRIVRGHGRILAVEDEDNLRRLLKDMLVDVGYDVHLCEDGQSAVEYYRRHGREIGLVLLDMKMPRMDGRECFAELRKINPDVRALLMSGYTSDADTNQMLADGAAGFLQKPFDLKAMSAEIRKHIRQAQD